MMCLFKIISSPLLIPQKYQVYLQDIQNVPWADNPDYQHQVLANDQDCWHNWRSFNFIRWAVKETPEIAMRLKNGKALVLGTARNDTHLLTLLKYKPKRIYGLDWSPKLLAELDTILQEKFSRLINRGSKAYRFFKKMIPTKVINILNQVFLKQKVTLLLNDLGAKIDLPDNSIDVCFSSFVFIASQSGKTPDTHIAIRELHRILKPGGIIYSHCDNLYEKMERVYPSFLAKYFEVVLQDKVLFLVLKKK